MEVEKVSFKNQHIYIKKAAYQEIDKMSMSSTIKMRQSSSSSTRTGISTKTKQVEILRGYYTKRERLARRKARAAQRSDAFPVPRWVNLSAHAAKKMEFSSAKYNLHHIVRHHSVLMSKKSRFSQTEAGVLVHIFWKVTDGRMKLTENEFNIFFTTTFNCAHRSPVFLRGYDRFGNNNVRLGEFVKFFDIIMRGTPEELARYVFEIYDIHGFGYLTREELTTFLGKSFDSPLAMRYLTDDENPVKDTIDFLMNKMNSRHTGRIPRKEFVACSLKDPLLRECCCDVLPSQDYISLFKAMLLVNQK